MSYLIEKRRQRAGRFSVLAILLLIACADLLFFARLMVKSLPPGGSFLTELARTPQEHLVMAALACWAVATVILSFSVDAALQPTAWVPLGILLMRFEAVSLALIAVSPPGAVGDASSLSATLHQIGYYAAMFFGAASPLILAPAFRWDPEWSALTWPGRFAALASIGTVVGLMLWPPGSASWWEIASIAALLFWLFICAVGVVRSIQWFRFPWEKKRRAKA